MAMFRWQAALAAALLVLSSTGRLCAQSEGETIELFAAIEAGQIEVEVIPRDAKRLNMIVTNETDQPLTIQLPGAALAQFFPQPGQQNNTNQQSQPQGLGFGFQAQQNVGQQPFGQQFGQQQLFPGGQFDVPAGRTIRVPVTSVCLEHGKPEPTPHHAYKIRPLSEFSDDPQLAALLESCSYGHYTQREAQLAVWHLTDAIAWDDFENARIEHLNGTSERAYTEREIERAQELLEKLPEQMQAAPPRESGPQSPGEVAQSATTTAAE